MLYEVITLYAQGAKGVFITEANDELNLRAVRSSAGAIRLTVPDTSATDTENLELLANDLV